MGNCHPLFWSIEEEEEEMAASMAQNQQHHNQTPVAQIEQPQDQTPDAGDDVNTDAIIKFNYPDLVTITNNFSNRVGEGRVYWGKLETSDQVASSSNPYARGWKYIAIKRIHNRSLAFKREFKIMVTKVSRLRHPNIVKLIGYCAQGVQRLVVYEYVPMASLEAHLYLQGGRRVLVWTARLSIAADVARGLDFLHNEKIVYGSLKSSNVLLGIRWHAKLSDLGVEWMVPRQQEASSSASTCAFAPTSVSTSDPAPTTAPASTSTSTYISDFAPASASISAPTSASALASTSPTSVPTPAPTSPTSTSAPASTSSPAPASTSPTSAPSTSDPASTSAPARAPASALDPTPARAPVPTPGPAPAPGPSPTRAQSSASASAPTTSAVRDWMMHTKGYGATECADTGRKTIKSDVYSYGILLLELISGERPDNMILTNRKHSMIDMARQALTADHPQRLLSIVDEKMPRNFEILSLRKVVETALMCVADDPKARPSMKDVAQVMIDLANPSASADSTSVDSTSVAAAA